MKSPVALITGMTGQDGSYMAELLLGKGYRVVGVVRNLRKAEGTVSEALRSVKLVEWDMMDQHGIEGIISSHSPDEIYNFAAYSSGAGMYDDPVGVGEVNGLAVTRILEAIRKAGSKIRFCQASSREIFGEAVESPQTESTLVNPRSPYGAAKLYADSMVHIYRQHYDIFACSSILFNHESPRRGLQFVTRKITHTAAEIKLGLAEELHLGNMDAMRDWGFAGDYVRGMWQMLQQDEADDYVLATGEIHTVREFCDLAFSRLGLDYRDYVHGDGLAYRPDEPVALVGNTAKATEKLGWKLDVAFKELVYMMVDADMQSLSERNQMSGQGNDNV